MEEEKIRQNIARNITAYRKRANLTQLALAEKMNYSDKAISKWERGEGFPDIFVLLQLTELFGITIQDLIGDKPKAPRLYYRRNRVIITILSSLLVWLVAVSLYVILNLCIPQGLNYLAFIYAVPINFIIFVVFASLWSPRWLKLIAISGLIWTVLVDLYITLVMFAPHQNNWMIYLIGVPVQCSFLFFFMLKKKDNL